MKRLVTVCLALILLFSLLTAEADAEANTMVVCYSRAGDNYSVGVVEKGNTQILAEMIADKLGAELAMIDVAEPYPSDYRECTEVVHQEMAEGIHRELLADADLTGYETVFIGYPIWWGQIALPMQTYLEMHDWQGITIIPFNTHEGSGESGTTETIRSICVGATVTDGFAVRGATAQHDRDTTEKLVNAWLVELGYVINE